MRGSFPLKEGAAGVGLLPAGRQIHPDTWSGACLIARCQCALATGSLPWSSRVVSGNVDGRVRVSLQIAVKAKISTTCCRRTINRIL